MHVYEHLLAEAITEPDTDAIARRYVAAMSDPDTGEIPEDLADPGIVSLLTGLPVDDVPGELARLAVGATDGE